MTRRAVEAVVEGRVQGVFYRASMHREAEGLGLVGWVCNRPDGTVAFRAEGPAQAVAELLGWARHGPPHAEVTALYVEEVEPDPSAQGFAIRR